ncbi:MAG: hypothetical protein KAQ83_03055 [Nanoarchaeota archaeon]|nr:hypothetical protein [Nanoarchaeota archaeon]
MDELRHIIKKKHIFLVDRGNSAIKVALKTAQKLGNSKVYIPDQGGWMTYRQFPKKFGLEQEEIKTDYGLIKSNNLKKLEGVLLYQSLAGYFAEQDVKGIRKKFKGLIILDVCNLSKKVDLHSDILIGSFGQAKVVDLGYGGFIATDDDRIAEQIDIKGVEFADVYFEKLVDKLLMAKKRLKQLCNTSKKVKKDLKKFKIIHKDKKGINVIVKFSNEEEKGKIIDYCSEKEYEYTLCPRYIRVNEEAVSIELKRLS